MPSRDRISYMIHYIGKNVFSQLKNHESIVKKANYFTKKRPRVIRGGGVSYHSVLPNGFVIFIGYSRTETR